MKFRPLTQAERALGRKILGAPEHIQRAIYRVFLHIHKEEKKATLLSRLDAIATKQPEYPMSENRVTGSIPEIIEYYREVELRGWKRGDKSSFPLDPRLAHFAYRQPSYYFGETHYIRRLQEGGFICWQERYQLFKKSKVTSKFYLYSLEIESLLGRKHFDKLAAISSKLSFTPVNPDIVAYHPQENRWAFFEVKLPRDKVRQNQINSLALLRHILKADVAIVRLVPEGRQPKTTLYPYDIEIK